MNATDLGLFIQINDVLCRFFLAFDQKDWSSMADCLASEVAIDYASSGREAPLTMSGQDFVERRRKAVDSLAKHHSFSNLLVTQVSQTRVSARCNYLILRFSSLPGAADEDFFHSCGSYEFGLSTVDGYWKIASIKQNALRSWGNASLHGGSAQGGR
ncbi:hypothetical protein DN820_16520 [Stutzerimonas nosocomialis]|uniref:SnoaL-like domain-containing protein n=1 Tax=Stutzerimonas nosocomialis TaxID=1056496 RepID=A0A5R9QBR8_9GAMM|nr:nuclear transport factor 2 family protein [Stutzerimonas nosocomialis]TLX62420.1 hypothetical protein DN820_16520 [Stutzerimonas nosocomialis]